MRQQVNLLPAGIGKRRKRPFSQYLAASVVVLVVAIAGIATLLAYLNHRLIVTNETLAQNEAAQRSTLAQLRASEATRAPRTDLLSALERVREELAARRALHEALASRQLANTTGFTPLLTGLALHKPDSVWLRGISFAAGGHHLELRGSALEPAAIPVYLQRFSDDSALAGRLVRHLEINQPHALAGHVDFAIRTELRP